MQTLDRYKEARTITVRASSWGQLFDCAHSWEGANVLGLRRPSNIRASLGSAVHAGTAAFDQARIEGNPITPSEAAEVFLDVLHNPDEEVDYQQDRSLGMIEAERIGLTLHTRYCTEISPRFTFKAIEMRCEPVDIQCGEGLVLRLTGTMDRARVASGTTGVVIPDLKTGARLIDDAGVILKGRSAQLGAYQIMYEQNTGEETIGGQIIGLQTSNDPKVGVSRVFDAKRAMVGDGGESHGMIEYAIAMLKSGMFPPNPQSSLCSERYCARHSSCIYHD